MTHPSRTFLDRSPTGVDPAWGRTALAWGTFAGIAFAVATVAYVAEATGLLASAPTYVVTGAGQLADEAAFHVAAFAYGQRVEWDFWLRDGLYFFAYLALIPLADGLREIAGGRRVAPQLAGAFLTVAAVFGCLNAVATFVMVDDWRSSGWEQLPAEIMVAVGRDLDLMDGLTRWVGTASFAALAIGLYYVGRCGRSAPALPRWLGAVAYLGGAILVALIVLTQVPDTDAASNLLSLAVGFVVAPLVTIGLGIGIARAAAAAQGSEEP
jgi:hypothetical protein